MSTRDILVIESDRQALANVHNALTDLGYARVKGIEDGRYGVYRRGEEVVVDKEGSIVLDSAGRTVSWKGGCCKLTEQQFAVLEHLVSHPRSIVPRAILLECVLDYSLPPSSNVVATCISTLRAALAPIGLRHLVLTVRSAGYRINPSFLPHLAQT